MSQDEDLVRALTLLRTPQTRIYLGARYGLTPHTWVDPERANRFLNIPSYKKQKNPFCDLATELESAFGNEALQGTFADKYGDLDTLSPKAKSELSLLRPFSASKFFVTGCYSTEIVNNFDGLASAFDDSGRKNIRLDAIGKNTFLIMLHGWRGNPSKALLTREEIDAFDTQRPEIMDLTRALLRDKPWLILGCHEEEDATFLRLCKEVCRSLGFKQRPIYVVDPNETEGLFRQWHRDPLRHVRMDVEAFLLAAARAADAETSSKPSPPPAPPSPADFVPDPDEPEPPASPLGAQGPGDKEEGPPPPEPGAARRIEIVSLDGRVFQTNVPSNMRISTLAGQFIRRFVHGDSSNTRRERVVVDHQTADGWNRLDGNSTPEEAGIRDGDRLRVYTDAVAAAVDPRRHEAYLNDVQLQLEALARQDNRVRVKPNLPQASDRYELTLSCGGWGPPEAAGIRPPRTFEQKILIEYPADAPNVAPIVWWQSEIYHPNVKPKTGYVCLGALKESWTPLLGPQELVRMLIELSEYRNFELDGVLNREAAIWAQLNPEIIVENGGWAYQPTLEEHRNEGPEPELAFEPQPTGVGLKRRRKS